MNLLYIHGLDSSPRPDKVAVLQTLATKVWAPQLDYRNNNNVFSELLKLAKSEQINFIVGSSAGGFMGYWLTRHLDCRALLYNPALAFQSIIQQIAPLEEKQLHQAFYQIILGKQDDIISPQSTLDYLKEHDQPDNYQIETIQDLGHQIDMNTFEYTCHKYISKLNF